MMEIADQGDIEEEALVEYIIDGIQDLECNKVMLYDARSAREVRKKLELYDKMKKKSKSSTITKKESFKLKTKTTSKDGEALSSGKASATKRCFNCGSKEHYRNKCTNQDKGPKCFKCNEFGHIAPKCTREIKDVSCVRSVDVKLLPVRVNGRDYHALVDTGSDVNLMQYDVYKEIGNLKLDQTTRVFTGLGNTTTKPCWVAAVSVEIDNEAYSTQMYVVPTKLMTSEIILGQEWMKEEGNSPSKRRHRM